MGRAPGRFGIVSRRFERRFTSAPGQLVIEGIGIDLVTEPGHYLQVFKEVVQFLAEKMGLVLAGASKKHHIPVMTLIEGMKKTTILLTKTSI